MKKFFDFFLQDDATAVNGKTNGQENMATEIDKENAPTLVNGVDKENQPEENGKENQVLFCNWNIYEKNISGDLASLARMLHQGWLWALESQSLKVRGRLVDIGKVT